MSATKYPISTLRDIFNLPTIEQMETCLDEIKTCMMQGRVANDLTVSLARKAGMDIDRAFEWPEVMDWIDDGKGECGTTYVTPDGEKLFSMTATKEARP